MKKSKIDDPYFSSEDEISLTTPNNSRNPTGVEPEATRQLSPRHEIATLREAAMSLRRIASMIEDVASRESRQPGVLDFDHRKESWQDAMDSGEPE